MIAPGHRNGSLAKARRETAHAFGITNPDRRSGVSTRGMPRSGSLSQVGHEDVRSIATETIRFHRTQGFVREANLNCLPSFRQVNVAKNSRLDLALQGQSDACRDDACPIVSGGTRRHARPAPLQRSHLPCRVARMPTLRERGARRGIARTPLWPRHRPPRTARRFSVARS